MLFGHDNTTIQGQQTQDPAVNGTNPLAADPATGISLPATADDNSTLSPAGQTSTSTFDNPLSDESSNTAPELGTPQPQSAPVPQVDSPHQATPPANVNPDDLLSLKQNALSQLTPLVSHLDQTPEEKFRTTMMMIQSTDNQSLIKDAYDAAQAITDDKTRAQALLDVINEINYFTQQKNN